MDLHFKPCLAKFFRNALQIKVGMESATDYVFDRVQCQGTETSLDKCRSSGVMRHNCGENEAAGVLCAVTPVGNYNFRFKRFYLV